jgi:hypothetical protein
MAILHLPKILKSEDKVEARALLKKQDFKLYMQKVLG